MSMVIYVGLDVHLNSIAAVWGQARETARSMTVAPDEAGLDSLTKAVGTGEVWGVYEASSCGFEVYDELRARGWKMSVVAPTHMSKSVHGKKRKTDLKDAEGLREALMSHGELGTKLPVVWIPGKELQEDRELVRRRLSLGEDSCRIKNKILGLLRMHRLKKPEGIKTAWSERHLVWLRGLEHEARLGAALRVVLGSLVRSLEHVKGEIGILEKAILGKSEEPKYRASVEKMTEVPGVGVLTAMTFLLELGDLKRFNNRRQVGSYLGLVPATYESGEANDRKGHITRLGPPRVRKVLNQAAWQLVRRDPLWRERFEGISERGGKKNAIVAIMRKLGIALWQIAKAA